MEFSMVRRPAIVAAFLVLVSASFALAQGTYTQIDVPGSTYTGANGINSTGDIVGSYGDGSAIYKGFILSGNTYTAVVHFQRSTYLSGINDVGQAVGVSGFSFIYNLQTRKYSKVNDPRFYGTYATSINNAGVVVGYVYNQQLDTDRGFELVGSTYSLIAPPGTQAAYVYGITTNGDLVGRALGSRTETYVNFSERQGTYKIVPLSSIPGASINGINPSGTAVVGSYAPSSKVTAGFVYQGTVLETLQFPGSNHTVANAINDSGEVVGTFFDSDNVPHGFLWTPPTPPQKK
jgi:probable HAF family extracellular repeat protein